MVDPVRPIELSDIEAARERIAGTVLRPPLARRFVTLFPLPAKVGG